MGGGLATGLELDHRKLKLKLANLIANFGWWVRDYCVDPRCKVSFRYNSGSAERWPSG